MLPTGEHAYVIKANRTEGNIAAWIFLVHKDRFTEDEFKAQVAESEKMINEVRIPKRRDETAKRKIPMGNSVEEAQKMNDILFEQDAEFLEVMMIDRFGYRKLVWAGAEAKIIPTILGLGG